MTVVTVNIQCCHVGYVYNSTTGECVSIYNRNNDIILGPERISNKYVYIRVSSVCIKGQPSYVRKNTD